MNAVVTTLAHRPLPPADLVSISGAMSLQSFQPSSSLHQWIHDNYLEEAGPLFNPDHAALRNASIGVLWTATENTRHGRRIIGQAELCERIGRQGGKWARARSDQQLAGWFGDIPDFLLTFDALWADSMPDAAFAALVDHELYHCAQASDEFGMPRFNKTTGLPVWTIRGHDVEEFTGVVRRFGIEAAGEQATDFVIAAAQRPQITAAKLAQACGNCVRKAA